MKQFKTQAHIHSLDGGMDEVTIIQEQYMFGHKIPCSFIAKYKNVYCTAVFNGYVGQYYVDDKYGVVTEYERATKQ